MHFFKLRSYSRTYSYSCVNESLSTIPSKLRHIHAQHRRQLITQKVRRVWVDWLVQSQRCHLLLSVCLVMHRNTLLCWLILKAARKGVLSVLRGRKAQVRCVILLLNTDRAILFCFFWTCQTWHDLLCSHLWMSKHISLPMTLLLWSLWLGFHASDTTAMSLKSVNWVLRPWTRFQARFGWVLLKNYSGVPNLSMYL